MGGWWTKKKPEPQPTPPSWPDWAKEEEEKLLKVIQKYGDKFSTKDKINILLIGLAGAGKSTLVSSLRSCITHEHGQEVAAAGCLETGDSFTFRLRRYEALENDSSPAVIYDMPGLHNNSDDRISAILRCILRGEVPNDEPILVTGGLTRVQIEENFPSSDPSRKIDRIVFVQSCKESHPENLIHTVFNLSRELDVVVFTVLTHIDFTGNKNTTLDMLGKSIGTEGSPRGFEMEMYHAGTRVHGRYKELWETNYYLYLLWQGLLNRNYPKHSAPTQIPKCQVLQPETEFTKFNIKERIKTPHCVKDDILGSLLESARTSCSKDNNCPVSAVYRADDPTKTPFLLAFTYEESKVPYYNDYAVKCVSPSPSHEAQTVFNSRTYTDATSNPEWSSDLNIIIQQNSKKLFKNHSNLTMISAAPVKSYNEGKNIKQGRSIVFFCLKKGYIPVGEKPFPKALSGIQADVCEGYIKFLTNSTEYFNPNFYQNPLKIGCAISYSGYEPYGTLGGFVQKKSDSNIKGFLTCCHVFMNESTPPTESLTAIQPDDKHFEDNVHDGFDTQKSSADRQCGTLSEFEFADRSIDGRDYGIDAAFVKVSAHQREITDAKFAGVRQSEFIKKYGRVANLNKGKYLSLGELEQQAKKKPEVFKCGAVTGLTKGEICFNGAAIQYSDLQIADLNFTGSNFIEISTLSNLDGFSYSGEFASGGDSGAFVFFRDSQNDASVIGMLVAISFPKGTYLVTPIEPLLTYFDLELMSFQEQALGGGAASYDA